MAENLIERYLSDIGEILNTRAHVPETSFYPALERLLSDIGKSLSPKVRCVVNIANRGAGIPDGGLFSADQFAKKSRTSDLNNNPFLVQVPSRGAIEAKPPSAYVRKIAESEQVGKYWARYRLVLVTNFRAFIVVGRAAGGGPGILESFTLAETESEFRSQCAHPRAAAAEHGERMLEYLKRVLLLNAPLAAPQDVAGILASYAHEARLRIEKTDLPALTGLREALEQALGLKFDGERGDHFFRSTLVQTLFYGVFSAWVLWSRQRDAGAVPVKSFAGKIRAGTAPYASADRFDWRFSHWLLRVPMLRGLFVQVSDPGSLGALDLVEVLDWTSETLNRVDRKEFFKSFDEGHAVQYFYEPFLQAFDPQLRKDLGVWYTPEEIVRYQVERVDAVLRSELHLPDGLADPNVVVLDPCCGTGAYLRAVLRRMAETLRDKGGDALVAHDLKKAAIERVFGFEILPAPFVISHLQIGLELEHLGAPLDIVSDPPERAGVFLTNALTGWEPPKEAQKKIMFPGFEEERDAAEKVKREKPILVILGNPPYNAFAGVSPEEDLGLVELYKKGLNSEWGIKKFNLDDLYIRFFRLAEKRIAEHGGRGVVSFISNHSWISEPSFVVMRRHLLDSFDRFWIENMHGNRKISEYAPDGRTSETVFAISGFSVGIQQGVAISIWAKHRQRKGEPVVRFRDDINEAKAGDRRAHLLATLKTKDFNGQYETATPRPDNRWSFRPSDVSDKYLAWPSLVELCLEPPITGLKENRGFSLIADDRNELNRRMHPYFDKNISWDDIKKTNFGFTKDAARFDAKKTRTRILEEEVFDVDRIIRYTLRPFEYKWCYYTPVRPLWNEPRPSLFKNYFKTNSFFVSRPSGVAQPEGIPFYWMKFLGDFDFIRGHSYHFPLCLVQENKYKSTLAGLDDPPKETIPNLSSSSRAYLASLGLSDPDKNQKVAEMIWYHALAIGYSPAYLTKNADGIRQDWPRIPLPKKKEDLVASAELGRKIAALLDTENPVPGVTAGKIRDEFRSIGVFQRDDGKPAKPEAGDLDLTAGWGHAGKGGVTMPGKGKSAARKSGALDIYLNDVACWRNIPVKVWDYTIGGYQVIKKWLSYREKPILGRGLTPDEVRYVTEMARRIAAIIALEPELDENYKRVVKATYAWPFPVRA